MTRVDKDTLRNIEIRRGADIQERLKQGIRETMNSEIVKIRKSETQEFNNPCGQELSLEIMRSAFKECRAPQSQDFQNLEDQKL